MYILSIEVTAVTFDLTWRHQNRNGVLQRSKVNYALLMTNIYF